MTVNIALANTNDAYISSWNDSYSAACNGSNLAVQTGFPERLSAGQLRDSSQTFTFQVNQAFASFPYVHDSTQLIASAYFRMRHYNFANSNSKERNLRIKQYNFGASVDTGDWRSSAQLVALPGLAELENTQNWGSSSWASIGDIVRYESGGLNGVLTATSTISTVIASERQETQSPPGTDGNNELLYIRSSQYSPAGSEPRLVWHTLPASTLALALGASVQLSDGTTAFLEPNVFLTQVALKHNDGVAANIHTSIATAGLDSFWRIPTAQAMTLVRDASDNLYVIGQSNNNLGRVRVRAYIKGAGYTWTPGTIMDAVLPTTMSNQYAAAWHPGGSPDGTILVVAGRQSQKVPATDPYWLLLDCSVLLAGSGTVVRGSGSATNIAQAPSTPDFQVFWNPVGTGLDVAAAPNSARGFVVSFMNTRLSLCRYELNATRTGFLNSAFLNDDTVSYDAAGKARIHALSDSQFVKSYRTYPVDLWQSIGFGSINNFGFVSAATLRDNLSTLTGIDATTYFADNAKWDSIYDPASNKVYLYYFDVANGRRLMKTSFNVSSGQAALDQVEVATNIGAVGSTNLAIRLPRGRATGDRVHIAIANRSSGGTLSTIYLYDSFNVAPNAPVLVAQENYDATTVKTFNWAFSDPNTGDSQSAYEFQIKRVSDGVDVVATGKVTSTAVSRVVTGGTLANGQTYQWRVRTWDSADLVGPWSGYGQFLTSAGGTVTITDPAIDNPPDQIVSSYDVAWSVSGATQEEYRFRMLRSGVSDYLLQSGNVGGYASTPHHTSLNIAGDLFVATYVAADDWTPGANQYLVAKFNGTGNRRQYRFLIQPSGVLTAGWSVDGVADQIRNSTVAPTVANGQGLAVAWYLDVNNGAGGHTVTFYTAPSLAGPWTVLGAPVITAGTTSIYTGVNATAPLEVGSVAGGVSPFAGKIYGVEVRSGDQAGTIVANPDFTQQTVGATSFTDGVGKVWTVSGDATIVGTSSTLHDTGWVVSTNTSYLVNNIPSDEEVTFSVQIRSGGVASAPGTRLYTTSYATPEQPLVTLTPVPSGGYMLVGVENPEPAGDIVQVQYNEILRRRVDSADTDPYVKIGQVGLNGEFRDYSAAGGVPYEYLVRGQA